MGYNKDNCKWILKSFQPKNRRNTIEIYIKSQNYKGCLKDACRILNFKYYQVLRNFKKFKKLPNEFELWNSNINV